MNGEWIIVKKIGLSLLVLALVSVRKGSPEFPAGREGARPRIEAWTGVVEFRLGERESRAVIRTRGKVWTEVLPSRGGIERSVNGFIRAVGRSADHADAVCRAARRIAAEILPFEPDLAALGVSRLILIPDGILGRLAFEALRTGAGEAEAWLIDRYAVSYAPSGALYTSSRMKPETEGTRLLALGAAALRPERAVGRFGRNSSFLNSVRGEIRAVGRLFPRRRRCIYLNGDAGRANFQRHRGECFQVVHIAAHGRRPVRPIASTRLIFPSGRGKLRAGDIRGCGISAEMVVLSACETAVGALGRKGRPGGLPRAFLREGARSVVATLWPVADRTTAEFVADFYGGLKTGLDKSASLRSAKRMMIRRGRVHPFYWAGYLLFGEPDGTIAFS